MTDNPAPNSEFSQPLWDLVAQLKGEINDLYDQMSSGSLSIRDWYSLMGELLARYQVTSYKLGADIVTLNEAEKNLLADMIAEQLDYLSNFAGDLERYVDDLADYWARWRYTGVDFIPEKGFPDIPDYEMSIRDLRKAARTELPKKYAARARSYADSIIRPFWSGYAGDLPLPAMPGDGSSQCLTHDRCEWVIEVVDDEAGDYDCFWVLHPEAEHCQTCITRARLWYPLKIRGFEVVYAVPVQPWGSAEQEDVEVTVSAEVSNASRSSVGKKKKESGSRLGKIARQSISSRRETAKHLSGKHDQKLHGSWASSSDKPRQPGQPKRSVQAAEKINLDWQGRPLDPNRKIAGGNLTSAERDIIKLAMSNPVTRFEASDADPAALETLKKNGLVELVTSYMKTAVPVYTLTSEGKQVSGQLYFVEKRIAREWDLAGEREVKDNVLGGLPVPESVLDRFPGLREIGVKARKYFPDNVNMKLLGKRLVELSREKKPKTMSESSFQAALSDLAFSATKDRLGIKQERGEEFNSFLKRLVSAAASWGFTDKAFIKQIQDTYWEVILRKGEESGDPIQLSFFEYREKHLSGKHDQKNHGRRAGSKRGFDDTTTEMAFYDNMMDDPEYYWKSKGLKFEKKWMKPVIYLLLVSIQQNKSLEQLKRMVIPGKVKEYADLMKSGTKFPMLMLDRSERGKGQEGRTRAFAAIEAGIDSVPVMIVDDVKWDDPEYKAETTKHLSGKHDQKTHGSWAKGKGFRDPSTVAPDLLDELGTTKWTSQDIKKFYLDTANREFVDATGVRGPTIPKFFDVWGQKEQSELKHKVVLELSEETGIPYSDINDTIRQWAATSNDNSYAALTLQKVAAEEFGLELSNWQKDKLTEVETERAASLRNLIVAKEAFKRASEITERGEWANIREAEANLRRAIFAAERYKTPFERLDPGMSLTKKADNPDYAYLSIYKMLPQEPKFTMITPQFVDSNEQAYKTVLRAVYNKTQKMLKDAGITEITLARGLKAPARFNLKRGDLADLSSNALESWTIDTEIANNFASRYDSVSVDGILAAATFPASRILSFPMSGWGCLNEFEFIVMNSSGNDEVVVLLNNSKGPQ